MTAASAAANAAYARAHRRRAALGQTGYVDAAPVRAHVQRLQRAGLGAKRIAELAGVADRCVSALLWGRPKIGQEPTRRVRPETAKALLAVRAGDDQLAAGRQVDATGTRRRVQGLLAMGWTVRQIAARAGLYRERLQEVLRQPMCTARTQRRIRALYDAMSLELPPTGTPRERATVTAAKRLAGSRGWAPPLAWDDDSIDDPDAVPDLGAAPTSAVDLDDDEFLRVSGVPDEQIAARMGVTLDGLQTARRRAAARPAALAAELVTTGDSGKAGER